VLRLDVDVR